MRRAGAAPPAAAVEAGGAERGSLNFFFWFCFCWFCCFFGVAALPLATTDAFLNFCDADDADDAAVASGFFFFLNPPPLAAAAADEGPLLPPLLLPLPLPTPPPRVLRSADISRTKPEAQTCSLMEEMVGEKGGN